MSNPNILLIFAEEVASILGTEVQDWGTWGERYYIESSIYSIFMQGVKIEISEQSQRIMDMAVAEQPRCVCEFNLADPGTSPESVAAKVVELTDEFLGACEDLCI